MSFDLKKLGRSAVVCAITGTDFPGRSAVVCAVTGTDFAVVAVIAANATERRRSRFVIIFCILFISTQLSITVPTILAYQIGRV